MNAAHNEVDYFVAVEDIDWRIGAHCGQVDPDLFFDNAEDDELAEEQAILICKGCPVARECLDAAMLAKEEYGIWGGMTPRQRKRHMASWMRLKGGSAAVKALRETNGIASPRRNVDNKYEARQQAASRCRTMLLSDLSLPRWDDYMMVLDMILANPSEVSDRLAQRIGRSATWFNSIKREVYGLFGISEGNKTA